MVIWHKCITEPAVSTVDPEDGETYSVKLLLRKPLGNKQHRYLPGRYEYHYQTEMFFCGENPAFHRWDANIEWCYLHSKDQSEHNYLRRLRQHLLNL